MMRLHNISYLIYEGIKVKTKFFSCECSSFDHLFSITYDNEDCFICVHLSPKSLFQRIIGATKYIFGFRSKYGDFEEIIIKKDDVQSIIDILHAYGNKDTKS